ncbi:uncharacterized protein ACA1_022560, partial [Acanthamoeba castellanii str. Neff]
RSVLVRSRGPGHEKEATALLVSWFIFNIILYLLFMTLIILFEELPKDSVTDSCLGRVARKDTTGLSDAQFTLSIVYKVMVASVSIIMALLFLIAGGGLHYKLVILGKAKGGNSNWKPQPQGPYALEGHKHGVHGHRLVYEQQLFYIVQLIELNQLELGKLFHVLRLFFVHVKFGFNVNT